MEFSAKEIQLIKDARIKANRSRYIKYLAFFLLIATSILMFLGLFGIGTFAIVTIFFAVFALVEPQFYRGPNYKELTDLLAQKAGLNLSPADVIKNAKDSGTQ